MYSSRKPVELNPFRASPLMEQFWNKQLARNEKLSILYVAIHKSGSTQPKGYVLCWDSEKEFVKGRISQWTKQYPRSKLTVIEAKPPL